MADENNENDEKDSTQASASKNETKRSSRHDIYYYNDRARSEKDSNSETTVSATNSNPEMDTVDAQQELTNPKPVQREQEPNVRSKSRRRVGRVEKRRRSLAQRHRRAPKRKPRIKHARRARDLSMTTIISGLSSKDDDGKPGCKYCGHRCCRRRYYEKRRSKQKRFRSKKSSRKYHRKNNYIGRLKKNGKAKKNRKKVKRMLKERISKTAELTQVGSRSPMFSSLYIKSSTDPRIEDTVEKKGTHSEVTPQMIHEGLQKLTAWRQNVGTADLLEYIRRTYPVNPDRTELNSELKEKLRIASLVGIVIEVYEDYWCLKSPLQRTLSMTHVTLFWKAYGDTLNAIKRPKKEIPNTEKADGLINKSYEDNINISDDII